MVSRLEYNDYQDRVTTISWFKDKESDEFYDFCGNENPLKIKWAGDRYSVTAPSSASVSVMIRSQADRDQMEDIFNGGYQMTIEKEGISGYFWTGEITPSLGIEAYKDFPYTIGINANDGMAKAEKRQFIMIDFPEPWPVKTSVLDFIIKLINTTLIPRDTFNINLAIRLQPDDLDFAASDLASTYIDPRVFMEKSSDMYLTNDKVLENLLGPLNLQLLQWHGEWWLLDLEAQWDEGKITYKTYYVVGETWDDLGTTVDELGILGLYDCGTTDVQINNSGRIDFLQPWRSVDIVQEFQMNSCILPVYANRTGNFYHGHEIEGTADFVPLEFIENYQLNVQGNLRHWVNEGLTVNQWGDATQDNTGFAWVNTVESRYAVDPVSTQSVVNPDITFDKFTFNISTMPTWKNEPNSMEGQFTPKTNIEVKYTDSDNNEWWFWANNEVGDFYGWNSEFRLLEFDEREISITSLMPDGSAFTGGTFTVKIYNSDDEHAHGSVFGMLINNLQLGIVSSAFENVRVEQTDKYIRKRKMTYAAIGWFLIDPVGFSLSSFVFGSAEVANQIVQSTKPDKVTGGITRDQFNSSDFVWDNTVETDICPTSDIDVEFKYIWGVNLAGVKSYHEYHLSSPYNSFGNAVDAWTKAGEVGSISLLEWKARQFTNDNSKYTPKLTGDYLSDVVSPFQLVSDHEGRVYKFSNGTWNDKRGYWMATFTEFKAVRNTPGYPGKGDFSTYDFNDDFYKLII